MMLKTSIIDEKKKNWIGLSSEGDFLVSDSGYKFEREIFIIITGVVFIYVGVCLLTIFSNERFFVENNSPVFVVNPFFNFDSDLIPDNIRSMEYLPPYFESGFDAPFWVRSVVPFSLMLLMGGFFWNHLANNLRWD